MEKTISFSAHLLRVIYNNVTLAILAKVHLIYDSLRESCLLNLNVSENHEQQIQNKWILVPEIMATTSGANSCICAECRVLLPV